MFVVVKLYHPLHYIEQNIGISCRFEFLQFVTSLEPPALTSYNLALFSIYGNDGTTISTRGVIINIDKYR